jgi:hypothetical protein
MARANAARLTIDYAPHPGQRLFHASRARTRVLACGARWGKDRAGINDLILQVIDLWQQRRGKNLPLVPLVHAWIVAPTYALVKQDWRELQRHMPEAFVRKVNESTLSMELPDGVLIECKSADRPETLVSVGIDVLVLTEAGLVSAVAWEQSLQPRLVSPGRAGLATVNGTPKGRHSWFHRLYLAGQDPLQPDIASWNFPTLDNPHIDRGEVEALRSTMPARWYQQEILAEWLDEAGGVFRGVRACVAGELEEPRPGSTYVMGVDLAKTHDFTVLVVLDSAPATE